MSAQGTAADRGHTERGGAGVDGGVGVNGLADFLARARARLAAEPEPAGIAARGDHDLTPGFKAMLEGRTIRAAAVLVPVVARPAPTVLLTQRTAHLTQHGGQIAFPGGKVDEHDASPLATALREAQEEVGLEPAQVQPVGYLDSYLSRTGFRIVPVVGLIDPAYELRLNPYEVDEAFEVPLAFLMSPANHQRHSREGDGPVRTFHAMPYGERFIWGITAGILHNLYERMYG